MSVNRVIPKVAKKIEDKMKYIEELKVKNSNMTETSMNNLPEELRQFEACRNYHLSGNEEDMEH